MTAINNKFNRFSSEIRLSSSSSGSFLMLFKLKLKPMPKSCENFIQVTVNICRLKLRVVQVRIHSTFEINVGSDSLRFSPTLNLDSL